MQGLNLIVVYDHSGEKLLMCRRKKKPYKGKLNFVGGKIEHDEDHLEAAYRELWEETSITRQDIHLCQLMSFTYPLSNCFVEVYAGRLKHEKEVEGDENDLLWQSLNHNFFSLNEYAGEGNIGHILEEIKQHPEVLLENNRPQQFSWLPHSKDTATSQQNMQGLNLIVVYDHSGEKLLMCRRKKDPYKGMLSFVGGKIDPGEFHLAAAYRELWEETAIRREDIHLHHLMDFTYTFSGCYVEVYAGKLKQEQEVAGEENELLWHSQAHNFYDLQEYAAAGALGHIIEQIKLYPAVLM